MSDYRTAIGATTSTIDLRARYFRNQVVIVVAIAAVTVVAAVLLRRASVLWAWLTIVPACGLFFYTDAGVLRHWRAAMLGAWVSGEIDFEVLRRTIRANPAIPKGTVEGMLQTLPEAESLAAEQRLGPATRRAVAVTTEARFERVRDKLLLKTLGSVIVVLVILAALLVHTWTPLGGVAALALLPVAGAVRERARQRRVAAIVDGCRREQGFSESDYDRVRDVAA
jgi:hypothetical protein